jgi:hypothetical protein
MTTTVSCLPRRELVDAPDDAGIAPEDWDLLFQAALGLLARVAVEESSLEGSPLTWQPPGTVLRECIAALDQLRRAVPLGRTDEGHRSAFERPRRSGAGFPA